MCVGDRGFRDSVRPGIFFVGHQRRWRCLRGGRSRGWPNDVAPQLEDGDRYQIVVGPMMPGTAKRIDTGGQVGGYPFWFFEFDDHLPAVPSVRWVQMAEFNCASMSASSRPSATSLCQALPTSERSEGRESASGPHPLLPKPCVAGSSPVGGARKVRWIRGLGQGG